MKHSMTTLIIGALLGGLVAACATPPEVRKLADKTAANVGTISAHLRQLDQNSEEIATLRADNISRLHAINTEMQARYEYDVELTIKASGDGFQGLITQIKDWANKVKDIFAKAKDAEATRKQTILATQTKLSKKSKALAEIAQGLAALAQEDKPADRLRFLKGYAKDLKKELDAALEADNANTIAAKELLDSAKKKLKSIN